MVALALAGFVGIIVGGLYVLYPLRFLKIRTRLQGFALLIASLVLLGYAGANMPPAVNAERRSVAAPVSRAERGIVLVSDLPPETDGARPEPGRKLSPMPSDQRAFLDAVEEGRDVFSNGKNDMQKGSAKPVRSRAICAALLNLYARNWVGEIKRFSTNRDGKGVLQISIGTDVTVQTNNNAFSNSTTKSDIEPSSEFFSKVSSLNAGDYVVFSGRFFEETEGCVVESSMTLRKSIEYPEFLMRFVDIAADSQ
jgi:hypothetical protein